MKNDISKKNEVTQRQTHLIKIELLIAFITFTIV